MALPGFALENVRLPFLLYMYPWMPFPRVVGIYLKERGISPDLVKVIHVSDPQQGDCVISKDDHVPPRPSGSLPILMMVSDKDSAATMQEDAIYIRQSSAILNFLEELCQTGRLGFPRSSHSMLGDTMLERARIQEIRTLSEELLCTWNPVRTFGSGAGSMNLPNAAKEMIPWVMRPLSAIEKLYAADEGHLAQLANDSKSRVTAADIVLFQFLEFVHTCYGIDLVDPSMDVTSGKDVYGRATRQTFGHLRMFNASMSARPSARRDQAGEMPSDAVLKIMQTWHEGVWSNNENVSAALSIRCNPVEYGAIAQIAIQE